MVFFSHAKFSMVKLLNIFQMLISLHCSYCKRTSLIIINLAVNPWIRTVTRYGDRAFSVIAPILWNKLSSALHNSHSLDQFKTLLTHTFNS